jgi:hypothetical protein
VIDNKEQLEAKRKINEERKHQEATSNPRRRTAAGITAANMPRNLSPVEKASANNDEMVSTLSIASTGSNTTMGDSVTTRAGKRKADMSASSESSASSSAETLVQGSTTSQRMDLRKYTQRGQKTVDEPDDSHSIVWDHNRLTMDTPRVMVQIALSQGTRLPKFNQDLQLLVDENNGNSGHSRGFNIDLKFKDISDFKTIKNVIANLILSNSQHQLNPFDRQSAIHHNDTCLNCNFIHKVPKEMSKHSVTSVAGDKDWDTALESAAHIKWNESKSKIVSLHIPLLVSVSKKDKSQRNKDNNDANFPFSSSQASRRTLIQDYNHILPFGWNKTVDFFPPPNNRTSVNEHTRTIPTTTYAH